MNLIVHAEAMSIYAEHSTVALDLVNPASKVAARLVCTPGQALKIAAQLMAAAEKADSRNEGASQWF